MRGPKQLLLKARQVGVRVIKQVHKTKDSHCFRLMCQGHGPRAQDSYTIPWTDTKKATLWLPAAEVSGSEAANGEEAPKVAKNSQGGKHLLPYL